jgi:hypothetical protein
LTVPVTKTNESATTTAPLSGWFLATCLGVVLGLAVLYRWSAVDYGKRSSAHMQMSIILGQLGDMASEGVAMPTTIEEVLVHARASSDRRSSDRRSSDLAKLSGRDPWGSPYQVECVLDPKYCGKDCYRLTVRSFGRNGRDNLGAWDDLQVSGPGWLPVPVAPNSDTNPSVQPTLE